MEFCTILTFRALRSIASLEDFKALKLSKLECFRNSPKIAISGHRNGKNSATIILGPETNQMVQFLAPETDIMGEQNYIIKAVQCNNSQVFVL